MQKYTAENVWWFKRWALGFPIDYYFGILFSFIVMIAPGFGKKHVIMKYASVWAVQFAVLCGLTGLMVLIY